MTRKMHNCFDTLENLMHDYRQQETKVYEWVKENIITLEEYRTLLAFIRSPVSFRDWREADSEGESDPDDDETVFALKPASCRTCWRDEFLKHCSSDVNGKPAFGWLCNNCGDFHVEQFKNLEVNE